MVLLLLWYQLQLAIRQNDINLLRPRPPHHSAGKANMFEGVGARLTQGGLIELRCGQWAQKMVDFWDLISATFLIIGKFRIPQNVSNRSCSAIAEVYLVQFWDPQVEFGPRYGLLKNCKSHSYSEIWIREVKWPGNEMGKLYPRIEFWRENMKFRDTVMNRYKPWWWNRDPKLGM